MAVRTDFTVDFSLSPRVILVAAPSVEVSIQDIVDTLRDFEDNLYEGMAYPKLINAAGKEDLGGGLFVGVTAELQNAVIGFEARTAALYDGTVTTANGDTQYIDSAATFITDGVMAGDVIVNHTDGSSASVLEIVSETELTTFPLSGGVDNEYDLNDDIGLHQFATCTISEGNLVAIDGDGASISPIFTTSFVTIDRKGSTAAALIDGGSGSSTSMSKLIASNLVA